MPAGRFAPSPTGPLHLGNLRTALVAWLCARAAGSPFWLRIEDLDRVASRPEHEAGQQADLLALGLDWDASPIRQSDRLSEHDTAIAQLSAAGLTYECWCTRAEIAAAPRAPHGQLPEGAYPGTCRDLSASEQQARRSSGRPPAMRLRADGVTVSFVDELHGERSGVVDDFVLRRNDGAPAYNLAVVVDDAALGVEEVVRGDDLLDTTPRQVLLARLLDLPVPAYAHVPLVLGPDGSRLAKRDGAVTLDDQRRRGAEPDEIVETLLASLSLSASTPAAAAKTFELARIPRHAWTVPAALVTPT